ncbi:DEAD/DEAH box helicase [Kutzneria albida]|uniref:RNA helicase n=1 Tax=Kutzneria albida DSM 43870 TaxID=1449976 RepID=W5WBN7_9PSEU|nr:DEAD/DEAH box helicase [Kutzneria albida]AHH98593.1 hypothetical protein KALB_5231 [Kutzneria albida DSM 43870]
MGGVSSIGFDELVGRAFKQDVEPYAYQRALAVEGFPQVLRVSTGAGKTAAAVLPWLWWRRFHPDKSARDATPRRLVVVLPQRALVEQTVDKATSWLDNLGLTGVEDGVGVHVLLGGASTDEQAWMMAPERDAVLVGTQDMVLSRLLMRGYAQQRASWPISFGLLHADSLFVFDEVQLMGPGLPTSLQLEGLRTVLDTGLKSRSMWMSATVDPAELATADHPVPTTVLGLSEQDKAGSLRARLEGTRWVEHAELPTQPARYPRTVAELALARHRPGTRTLVIVNTVDRAVAIHRALTTLGPAPSVVLVHSRFRPGDRATHLDAVLAAPTGAGTIAISTQVLEAGVDTSAAVLITEVASWPSIVQRAGRCNREGTDHDAQLLWMRPPGKGFAAPYREDDLTHAEEALRAWEGVAVTAGQLMEKDVPQYRPVWSELRRWDLVELFDTTPDVHGNDVDVTRWIRDAEDLTVSVAWRPIRDTDISEWRFPAREELCPAPVTAVRERLARPGQLARVYDRTDSTWRSATAADVRAGAVLVLDAGQGGYDPQTGFAATSTTPGARTHTALRGRRLTSVIA